jgi:hypothetical protein
VVVVVTRVQERRGGVAGGSAAVGDLQRRKDMMNYCK